MSTPDNPPKPSIRDKAKFLLQPENLAKTIGTQIPGVSAAVEMANQLAGQEIDQRIAALESEPKAAALLKKLEESVARPDPGLSDWSTAVAEYLQRTIDLTVVYDGGFHSRELAGRELVQSVAHGCILSATEILVGDEALQLATRVAETKGGRVVISAGMERFEFDPGAGNRALGLRVFPLGARDEAAWQHVRELWREHGLGELESNLIRTPVQFAASTWMGQEIGFIHSGEAVDVMSGERSFSPVQFDASVISHFRQSTSESLKTFVTGVLSGRILRPGSPAFGRDGTLLGILSGTESYPSDAGRRAYGRSLLGHPRFMR
ncbi:MAG: hypothetical protein EAZ65_05540 [Verrucomicrobia bacterium]|nr:MAG: hypothetical protein EAZ84_01085 [Verrucomicrobiota bacterium]TAE87857.1 MAG: hypothetical protein EAZ82_06485 [Verrucomicrobiota bacterium]TAF25600.1 MAG: hypothetical protein EAZ71_07410 [Verrucomicrobiota bacterium]TAF41333.1 MAG: hypothetical protein EAZ65_05540 [Verrucomicrobiota bacterium]